MSTDHHGHWMKQKWQPYQHVMVSDKMVCAYVTSMSWQLCDACIKSMEPSSKCFCFLTYFNIFLWGRLASLLKALGQYIWKSLSVVWLNCKLADKNSPRCTKRCYVLCHLFTYKNQSSKLWQTLKGMDSWRTMINQHNWEGYRVLQGCIRPHSPYYTGLQTQSRLASGKCLFSSSST